PLQLGFNKRNGQLPLGRQRRGIQPFEQIKQPLHITRAAGKDKACDVVAEVQTTTARAQQQRQYFVVVIQLLHRVGYPPVQSWEQIRQLNTQRRRRLGSRNQQMTLPVTDAVKQVK